jgi:hypothetical protein
VPRKQVNPTDAEAGPRRGNPDKTEPHRFKPGQSGNPAGRPKGRSLTAVVREMLDEALDDKDPRPAIERIVKTLLKLAESGDLDAAKLLFDRTDGPVKAKEDGSASIGGQVHVYLPHNFRDDLPGEPS